MTLQQKIQAMTISEIIMAMVQGLRNPTTKIDMDTFGKKVDGICYGCAATNAICHIGNYTIDDLTIGYSYENFLYKKVRNKFISHFESSIDFLRFGMFSSYNIDARFISIATIPEKFIHLELPDLQNNYTEQEVQEYENFAKLLQQHSTTNTNS